MARILYGVHGTGHGHAIRALTVARNYPGHEFLFVSHGDGASILRTEFVVTECPNPETPVCFHRVATLPAIFNNLRIWRKKSFLLKSVQKIIDRFKPDVAITDYEFFVPLACRDAGIPCLSLDHQHIVIGRTHSVPLSQTASYLITRLAIRYLFSNVSHFLVTSFFGPHSYSNRTQTLISPPLLRQSVLKQKPREGNHVIAYQGYSTFSRFFSFLKTVQRPVMVYGFDSAHTDGNLHFKKPSEDGFLQDLASSCYVICGGGHMLLSEALFYGKPVLSFPIGNAFEQFLNAFYLKKLGYGHYVTTFNPQSHIICSFEAQLNQFRKNIRDGDFCGNRQIFAILDRLIIEKSLTFSLSEC